MRNNSDALVIKRDAVLTLVLLIGVAIAAPVIFSQQLITGTIVNATIIVGVCLLGAKNALIIGLLPSSVALATGILSPALAPMIPFIIVGNTILVLAFDYLKNINYWVGVVAGAVLKFAFLYGMSSVVIGLITSEQIAAKAAAQMSWPQLVTALCGGILAFGVVKLLRREPRVD
jgi:hypothetical protein